MALVKLSVQMNDVIVTTLRNLSEQEYHCPGTLKMIADVLERSKEDSIIMNESVEEQRQDSSEKVSSVFAVSAWVINWGANWCPLPLFLLNNYDS